MASVTASGPTPEQAMGEDDGLARAGYGRAAVDIEDAGIIM